MLISYLEIFLDMYQDLWLPTFEQKLPLYFMGLGKWPASKSCEWESLSLAKLVGSLKMAAAVKERLGKGGLV